jgi:integrase
MSSLFKSKTVAYRDAHGKPVPRGSPGARKVVIVSKKWYGRYKDPATGRWVVRSLHKDKTRAWQKLADLESKSKKEMERGEVCREMGIKPETYEQQKRPLAEHLDDYNRFLTDKGSSQRQIDQVVARVHQVLDGCGFVSIGDINASFILGWLADRRKAPPAKGKRQLSKRTSNHYLSAVKSFSRWLVKNRRAQEDPLTHLEGMNPDDDIRHARRDLPAEDFDRFIEATRKGKVFRGLTGADRAVLYLLAANTGLRRSELASLTPQSFDLVAAMPAVVVEAGYSKHRRRDVQPLRADVVVMMKEYLKGKAVGKPVWPGTWKERTNRMVERDLAAAKAAWVDEARSDREKKERARADRLNYEDAGGHFFDFHSLRHQFISNLARAGVHPKQAQTLARHSKIDLTMNVYTHMGIADAAGALEHLPALTPVRDFFATFGGETSHELAKPGEDGGGEKAAS